MVHTRGFLGQKLQGGFLPPGAVLPGKIVVVLVGGDFGDEVLTAPEFLQVKELRFDGCVNRFHVGVGIFAARRVEDVARIKIFFNEVNKAGDALVQPAAIELGSIVGLDYDLPQIHSVTFQVLKQSSGSQDRVGD